MQRLLMICLTTISSALPSTATARPLTVGLGDNNPATFSDPRFLNTGFQDARTVVLWNAAIIRNGGERRRVGRWIRAVEAAGARPLIAFSGNGNYIPTVAQYSRAVKSFMRRFPSVTNYAAWNEPDWPYRRLSRAPRLAAAYFNTVTALCRKCTVLAGDVFSPAPVLAGWLPRYIRGLHYRPKAWGLHDYTDVRGRSTAQLQLLQRLTRGPIWLDETGGVLRRGHWIFANQSAKRAAGDERFLFSLPKRFPRIARIYHYQWRGIPTAGWDSGLLAPSGAPRPAYSVVARAIRNGG
jgi:hypothetical protein